MELLNDIDPMILAFVGIAGYAILVFLLFTLILKIFRRRWARQEDEQVSAGALTAPYGDLSIITPGNRSDELRLVHRDQPDKTLGTIVATSSGFLARYRSEVSTTYPTADEAAYALAARHVALAPSREAAARAAQDNARELQQFGESPRR